MWNAELDESQTGIKIARRNINDLRYADDITLMTESEEEQKSLFTRMKEESENLLYNVSTVIKTISKKKNARRQSDWLSEEALQRAEKRREEKGKGEREIYTQLNAEFQRIARRDKKAFLCEQCKEIKPIECKD